MSKELNCMNCCIGDFKESLCDCNNGMCKEYKRVGRAEDFEKEVLKRTKPKWTCTANFVAEHLDKLEDMSVSEKLKLIQDLLGVEFKEENLNYKHTSAEADRPSGEWTYLHGSIGSYMTISCPFCGKTFNDVAEWEYNYCPSCGARMKGGDAE